MKNLNPTIQKFASVLVFVSLLFGYAPGVQAQEGGEWTTPVNLSFSGLAMDPILVIDFQDTLHAIWTDDKARYKYSQSSDDGATWSAPQTAAFPFNPEGKPPKLIGDVTGAIHIFWIDEEGSLFYGQTTPANLSDQAKWQSDYRLASKVLDYDVVRDMRGALQLTYIHNASGLANPPGIFFMHTTPGGGGWSDPINLYASDYFRSTQASEAFLRVAVSNTEPVQDIYVTWDSRSQKRVFMAMSEDGGITWGEAQEVKGPQDTGGVGSPFNLNVAAAGENVMLLWQIGEPGSGKCSVSSQWSIDRGKTWGAVTAIPSVSADCPDSTQFISEGGDYTVVQMTGQGDPVLLAWDGERWSDPETQARLPILSNPLTYDAILLGCRVDLVHKDRLYVVGCDQGKGGDAWFLSRPLRSVEKWFAPLEAWSAPALISGESAKISSLVSVADSLGIYHSVWAQSSASSDGTPINSIEYAQWNGSEWSRPDAVIPNPGGMPSDLDLAISGQEKLLLTWVDENRGELLFSWVNLEQAGLASEWSPVVGLPAVSNLVASPDMVVDGTGRIVAVYAIPLNENRGLYVVQSTDSGQTWSAPVNVFDAARVKWDEVDHPEISLDQNGGLHVIFQRSSARSGQSLGLFYTRSEDGGTTWSDPQILSEGDIRWSEILTYDQRTIHVLWQEFDGLVYANLSQVSRDGGLTWGRPFSITGVNDGSTPVTTATDASGKIHFVQLLKSGGPAALKQDDLVLQDWTWSGSSWTFGFDRHLSIRGQGLQYTVASGITSNGTLMALILSKYSDIENQEQEQILALSRYLGEEGGADAAPAVVIPTPRVPPTPTLAPSINPTQAVDPAVLYDDNVPTTSKQRNLIGVGIVAVVLIFSALLLIRGRPARVKK